jgi:hypothetical protein
MPVMPSGPSASKASTNGGMPPSSFGGSTGKCGKVELSTSSFSTARESPLLLWALDGGFCVVVFFPGCFMCMCTLARGNLHPTTSCTDSSLEIAKAFEQ